MSTSSTLKNQRPPLEGGIFEERVFPYTPWTLGLYHGATVEGVISAAGEDMLLADGFSRLCMIPRCGHWLVLDLYEPNETMAFGNGPTYTLRVTSHITGNNKMASFE